METLLIKMFCIVALLILIAFAVICALAIAGEFDAGTRRFSSKKRKKQANCHVKLQVPIRIHLN